MDTTQVMHTRSIPAKRPARGGKQRLLKGVLWITTVVAVLATLPLFVALGMYAYYQAFGIILPGVRVGGVPLQGLDIYEATAELDRVWNEEYRITTMDITDSSRSWIVAPPEFGLRVDAQASVAQAYDVGRDGGLVAGMMQMLGMWREGWEITPWVTFDPEIARAELEAWAKHVNVLPVEGNLALNSGTVVQSTGQSGKILDIEASLALLAADPTAVLLGYRFVPLVLKTVEPAIDEVSISAAEVERLLGSGLMLYAYDPVIDERFCWTPTRQEIASWLHIERGQSEFSIVIDDDLLGEYLAALDISLGDERFFDHERALAMAKEGLHGKDAETLLIQYQPTDYVVLPTDNQVSISFEVGIPYWKLQEANPTMATRGLVAGETITVPPADAMLTLPVVINKRIVISINEQHMWVYQDGELMREHVVSTGMSSSPTLPGIFQVQAHYLNAYGSRWDLYMPHFLGIYEASPGFLNGIHGLPLLSNGIRLWGSVLGSPASYGCIILDLVAAEQLYYWAEEGVVVEIRR